MTMTGGPDASLQLGLESNQGNKRARIEIEFPGCESQQFQECPTADGIIRGEDNRRIGVKRASPTEGTVVWSQGIRSRAETMFRGVVDDNAKLDFFEPQNTEVETLTLGGANAASARCRSAASCSASRASSTERTYQLGPSTVTATITCPDLSGAALTATSTRSSAACASRPTSSTGTSSTRGSTSSTRPRTIGTARTRARRSTSPPPPGPRRCAGERPATSTRAPTRSPAVRPSAPRGPSWARGT